MRPGILSVLSDDECRKLVEVAMRILDEIGVVVTHAESASVLTAAGARRGNDRRLRMSTEMVQDLVRKAPSSFCLHDRRGGVLQIGGGSGFTYCGGTVAHVLDWPAWTSRNATRDDVVRFTRLSDALPLVHAVLPVVEAQDTGPDRAEIVTFAETLVNTTKFVIVCPVRHASAQCWVEMGRIAAGTKDLSARPRIGLLATVLPHLQLDDDCAATAALAAREGLPLIAMGGPIAGSTGPNTVASAAALKLAPELFLTAFVQAIRPGTPVLIDTGAIVLDMSAADITEGGPEDSLGVLMMAQAARRIGIPTYSCAMGVDAKIGDFQAGMEKMKGLLIARLTGIDLTTNIGLLSRCNAACYEQVLIDHELCSFVERLMKGVTTTDEMLALDVIREVGLGGEFILHPTTLKHCRSGEIWHPKLLDRTAVNAPRIDPYEKAHIEVERILASHKPEVPDDVQKAIRAYAETA